MQGVQTKVCTPFRYLQGADAMVKTERNTYIVAGYEFETEGDANEASREEQNILHLKSKVDFTNTESMKALYQRLVDKQVFKTPVGLQFLAEFRDYLVGEAHVPEEEVPSVKVEHKRGMTRLQKEQLEYLQVENEQLKNRRKYYFITIGILAAIIVVMLAIAALNPNVGYINTENKILNRYAEWEERLTERERKLNEREAELLQDTSTGNVQ